MFVAFELAKKSGKKDKNHVWNPKISGRVCLWGYFCPPMEGQHELKVVVEGTFTLLMGGRLWNNNTGRSKAT